MTITISIFFVYEIFIITLQKILKVNIYETFFLLPVMGVVIFAMSCSNNDSEYFAAEEDNSQANILGTEQLLNVTYNGKTYKNVPTTYDANGDFVFLDKELSSLYNNEISKNFNLNIFIKDNHSIVFYKNEEAMLKANNLKKIEIDNKEIATRAITPQEGDGGVELFDDQFFKDRCLRFMISKSQQENNIPSLKIKQHKFNDKCSSLILTNNLPDDHNATMVVKGETLAPADVVVVFVGFDDTGFNDRSITVVATASTVQQYPSLPGFNDKLSSFQLFFGKRTMYQTHF